MGKAIPPAKLFPRKSLNHTYYVGRYEIFHYECISFQRKSKNFTDGQSRSCLLIEALNLAKSSGATVLTLQPNTTEKFQSLDIRPNGPFKTYYNAEVDSLLLRYPVWKIYPVLALATMFVCILKSHDCYQHSKCIQICGNPHFFHSTMVVL